MKSLPILFRVDADLGAVRNAAVLVNNALFNDALAANFHVGQNNGLLNQGITVNAHP